MHSGNFISIQSTFLYHCEILQQLQYTSILDLIIAISLNACQPDPDTDGHDINYIIAKELDTMGDHP